MTPAPDQDQLAANKVIVGKLLAAMNEGPEAAMAWVTDDFVWHMCPSTEQLFPGRPIDARGLEGMVVLCEQGAELYDDLPPVSDLHAAVAEGDRVALHYTMRRRTKAGLPYENDYCIIFRLSGGKVAEVWKIGDSLYGKRQCDARPD